MINRSLAERLSSNSYESTVRELAQEKAASLGRAGRRLMSALDELASWNSARSSEAAREDLVIEAGEALFFYVVQREACGLRDSAEVIQELSVPWEVQLRMGPRPPRYRETPGL
jgi:hypothetical protein